MAKVAVNGKMVNVPEDTIERNMKALDLTREDAIALFLSDEEYEVDETVTELSAKAKTAGAGAKALGERTARKAPVRQPDLVKRVIVDELADYLKGIVGISALEITNIERMIAFAYEGDNYELTLTKKRKAKK